MKIILLKITNLTLKHLIIEILTNCQLKFLVAANSNFFFDLTVI
jgi:hypothetical protein